MEVFLIAAKSREALGAWQAFVDTAETEHAAKCRSMTAVGLLRSIPPAPIQVIQRHRYAILINYQGERYWIAPDALPPYLDPHFREQEPFTEE